MDTNSNSTTLFNNTAFTLRKKSVLTALNKYVLKQHSNCSQIKILDFGCGNGLLVKEFLNLGLDAYGVDVDEGQIQRARNLVDSNRIIQSSVYEYETKEKYDVVTSLEVIEHLYDPIKYLKLCHSHLTKNGIFIISTPYYGYLKNLLISIMNKWDKHHMSLTLHGHIKLFSQDTLLFALQKTQFYPLSVQRIGRIPHLAMMNFIVAQKIGSSG